MTTAEILIGFVKFTASELEGEVVTCEMDKVRVLFGADGAFLAGEELGRESWNGRVVLFWGTGIMELN